MRYIYAALILLAAWAAQAHLVKRGTGYQAGTSQILFSGASNSNPSTSAASYLPITSGYVGPYNGTYGVSQVIVPINGAIGNLTVQLGTENTAGATTSWNVSLGDGGNQTTFGCTVGNNASTCSNAGQIAVAAGDRINWVITPTNTPTTQTAPILITATFTTNQSGTPFQIPIFFDSAGTIGVSSTVYLSPGQYLQNATEINASGIMPVAGAVKSVYALANGTLTSGTYTVTLYKNGSSTALTCTISTSPSSCNATTSVSVSAGDTISLQITGASASTARGIGAGIGFAPTTTYNGIIFANTIATPPAVGSSTYFNVEGGTTAGATEATFNQLAPLLPNGHTLALSNLYVAQNNFSATAHRVVTLRDATSSSTVTCSIPFSGSGITIGGVSATPACTDSSHTFTMTSSSQPVLDVLSADASDTGSSLTWFKASMAAVYQ